MKTNRENTVSTKEPKKNCAHFSTSEIKKFTEDPMEQQMIGNYGMICPTCSVEMLHKYCPDCGRKTIIPNFCNNCKIECKTQFCDKCGTAILFEGMTTTSLPRFYATEIEQQLAKLITVLNAPKDHQTPMFFLVDVAIKALTEIKQEISDLSEYLKKTNQHLESIDSGIYCLRREVEDSFEKSVEKRNENAAIQSNSFTTIHSSLKEIMNAIDAVDSDVSSVSSDIYGVNEKIIHVDERIHRIEKEGVYFKPLI